MFKIYANQGSLQFLSIVNKDTMTTVEKLSS